MIARAATVSAVPSARASGSVVSFRPSQRKFIQDTNRLVGWLKGRQVGGSFAGGDVVALDVMAEAHGAPWNMMSRTGRQAGKLLAKVARFVRAADRYRTGVLGLRTFIERITSELILLKNGCTVSAMPCDADTTVGDSGNWFLDEFALFLNSAEIYSVVKPSIIHGYKLRVVSSPRGRKNKFYSLWRLWEEMGEASGWSWYSTTLQQAVSEGLVLRDSRGRRVSYDRFREMEVLDIGPDFFSQEYECVFLADVCGFLTWHSVMDALSETCPTVRDVDELGRAGRELFVGVDVGRRHDLTCAWVVSRSGDDCRTEAVITMDRQEFTEQDRVLRSILDTGVVVSMLVDEQGIGMQLAEGLAKDYPGVAQGVSLTTSRRNAAAGRLKVALECHRLLIPRDDAVIHDLMAWEYVPTAAGNVVLAARRDAGRHADRFWAAALAVDAAMTHVPWELVMRCGNGE